MKENQVSKNDMKRPFLTWKEFRQRLRWRNIRQWMKTNRKNLLEKGMAALFFVAACASILAVALICIFIFQGGYEAISQIGLFEFLGGTRWKPTADPPSFGIFPMIMGSIYVTGGAILIGVPIGILSAIFMARFCPKRLYRWLKPAFELLAGIPSIVYGFFGLMVLVPSGAPVFRRAMATACSPPAILLGIMILPTIIGISEAALRAVPESYYEGALALGASHERAVFKTVVPAAKSGILAGVVLGIGRAIGETMALLWVCGNQARLPDSIFDGVRTMTTNIVLEMGYAADLHRQALIATGAGAVRLYPVDQCVVCSPQTQGDEIMNRLKRKNAVPAAQGVPAAGINQVTWKERLASYRRDPLSLALRLVVCLAAAITAAVLLALIAYILIRGIPHLKPSLFELHYNSENVSMFPAMVMTLYMTVLCLLIATPLGVGCAIYLTEYAKRGNKVVEVIRLAAETLSGIPSIVYGLFGMLFFVTALGWKYSILAGACTLSIMVLPLIIRSTEEALKSVPDSYREASFGLGAGKLRTVMRVVLPPAMPGIVAGIILAVGRIVGETAALIYTAGTVAKITGNAHGIGPHPVGTHVRPFQRGLAHQ